MMADDNESVTDCVKIPMTKRVSSSRRGQSSNELQSWFYKLLKSFLNEKFSNDISSRPIPPVLADGKSVDLLELFLLVRDKGGYNEVSRKGLWDMVAKESGYDLKYGGSIRLVYIKYLDALELWLEKGLVECTDDGLMQLGAEFKEFLLALVDSKELKSKCEATMIGEMDSSGCKKHNVVGNDEFMDSVESGVNEDKGEGLDPSLAFDWIQSMEENMDGSKKGNDSDDNEEVMESDSDGLAANLSCNKRKRESLSRMLNWVVGIARNPFDPLVVPLPECSKWQSYGNEELWKQVLMVREGLLLRSHAQLSSKQSVLQKNQKMHPCVYDDDNGSGYNLRARTKCTKKFHQGVASVHAQFSHSSSSVTRTESSSGTVEWLYDGNSSAEKSMLDLPVEKKIPLGPRFQAEVQEWSGLVSESNEKWVGTRVWPQENINKRFIIEREPIGKGRQDSCGCQVPKSVECVRFHIAERKSRLKIEVGAAFYYWRFDKIGEEVARSWTEAEEKKFKSVITSNASSLETCYWDKIIKSFPHKKREDLVSYYFNVFLLRRRAEQNRVNPDNINSDVEEGDDRSLQRGSVG